jgi:hypothetical protein
LAVKVNVLGLVGAVIGLVAIFATWIGRLFGLIKLNLIDVLNDAPSDSLAYYSAILFVTGTLVAFLSSFGGVIQLSGVVLWWEYVIDRQGEIPSRMASYLALASGVIVLASMARPLGPGLMKGPFALKNRLLNFTG